MTPVERKEILDYVTYDGQRAKIREGILRIKEVRRVIVGDALTFLFENRDTVRYQVQEMMRTERIVKEADIAHEMRTYNELLGKEGELGCTLLIGIDDEAERDVKLRQWMGLNATLYVEVEGGDRVHPTWDPRQVGDDRLSSVQYLKFDVAGRTPVAVGAHHPGVDARTELTAAQSAALVEDLA